MCFLCVASCRDWNEAKGEWGWAREAPPSQKAPGGGDTVKKLRKKVGGGCAAAPLDHQPGLL